MGQSSKRFRINTLIQLARITEDEIFREELVLEIKELLDEKDDSFSCSYHSVDSWIDDEELKNKILEFLKNRKRTCVIEVWKKALGKSGKPYKWQSNQIGNIILEAFGWYKAPYPIRFPEYGPQRAYEKTIAIKESEE